MKVEGSEDLGKSETAKLSKFKEHLALRKKELLLKEVERLSAGSVKTVEEPSEVASQPIKIVSFKEALANRKAELLHREKFLAQLSPFKLALEKRKMELLHKVSSALPFVDIKLESAESTKGIDLAEQLSPFKLALAKKKKELLLPRLLTDGTVEAEPLVKIPKQHEKHMSLPVPILTSTVTPTSPSSSTSSSPIRTIKGSGSGARSATVLRRNSIHESSLSTPLMSWQLNAFSDQVEQFMKGISAPYLNVDEKEKLRELVATKLEDFKGPDFKVTHMKTVLLKNINAATSFHALQDVLASGVERTRVLDSDKSDISRHDTNIIAIKAVTAAEMLEKQITQDTDRVMAESGLLFKETLSLDDKDKASKTIREIVVKFYRKEIPNLTGGDQIAALITLLAKATDTVTLEKKFTKFNKEVERFKEIEAMGKRSESESSSSGKQERTLEMRHSPMLQRHNSDPVDIKRNASLLKFAKNPIEEKAFEELKASASTGFVVVPIGTETDQLQANMKLFSLCKDAPSPVNINPQPYKKVVYYKARFGTVEVDLLKSLKANGYELWVLSGGYMFAIHVDPALEVVSLTLNQGDPEMKGALISNIRVAQALMSATVTYNGHSK